jgi:hypothetical protein
MLTTCLLEQLGDGSKTQRVTPVAVSGLSSGVAMVALGGVRLFSTAAQLMLVVRAAVCVFD